MYAQQKEVLTKMNEYFANTETTIEKLQQELSAVKIERDAYKEELMQLKEKTAGQENIAYTVVYTHDNGEGMDTEVCIGVFSSHTKALQAIADVSVRNDVDSRMFEITEFDVGQPIQPKSKIYVTYESEEAHCEVSTRIIGVEINTKLQDVCTNKDVYDVKFIVDEYASVYPLGF